MTPKKKNKKQTKHDKLITAPFRSIEDVLSELSAQTEQERPKGIERFERFGKRFNESFSGDSFELGAATALTFAFLGPALQMYYVGNNASVFVELYGFVERCVLRDLPSHLARDGSSAEIVANMIARKRLSELAEVLQEMGVWSADDVSFAKKLTKVRDGIGHKNAELLSKHLGSGEELHILDANELVAKADCVSYFINSLQLLTKLFFASCTYKKRIQKNAQPPT